MNSIKEVKSVYKADMQSARREYKEKKREIKSEHIRRLDEFYETSGIERPKDPPKRPVLQEIGNAVTHGVGAVFAIVSLILMLVLADSPAETVAACIYSGFMFVTFSVSCLYHSFRYGSAVKRLFRRFDYSSIYLLIGATFAPVLLAYMGDSFGITFFVIQWSVIAVGIALVAVFGPTRLRFIHIPLYVVLGWSALMLMPRMMDGAASMAMWILAGGVVYSIGIIPYIIKYRASHFIWHFFVLAGAAVQWIGIFTQLYLN